MVFRLVGDDNACGVIWDWIAFLYAKTAPVAVYRLAAISDRGLQGALRAWRTFPRALMISAKVLVHENVHQPHNIIGSGRRNHISCYSQ
jgi:hypothetical protein